jgi:hypothetical protein
MANTAVGEVAIYVDGQEYTLRPSFAAMQELGTPDDIQAKLSKCMAALHAEHVTVWDLAACYSVIAACGGADIPDSWVGTIAFDDNEKAYWTEGHDPHASLIVIANHLLSYGIAGKPSRARLRKAANAKPSDSKALFDPLEYVGAAIAHLGLNKDDAWNLTMVEFQRAIDAKYPPEDPKKEQSYMSADELRNLKRKVGKASATARS